MVKLKFFIPRKFYHYIVSFREAEFKYKFSMKYLKFIPHHVGVVLDSFYFEMQLDGIEKIKYYNIPKYPSIEVDITNDFVTKDHKMIFKKYIRELYKKKVKYDYSGIIHYILPFIKQDKNRKYCSELIADGLKNAGYNIWHTKITPYRLLKTVIYNKVYNDYSLDDIDVKFYINNDLPDFVIDIL